MRYILNHIKRALFLFTACLFTACTTISYLNIETYNPAAVTFPDDVTKILLVNNAVAQPPDTGYEYKVFGVSQDTCRAYADSALFEICRSLGKAMVEEDYFDDVLLYHEATRTDDFFLEDRRLTKEKVQQLCIETGTDAIISVDRLLFQMDKDIATFRDGLLAGTVKVEVGGTIRAYLPYREGALVSVVLSDSVEAKEYAPDIELLNTILPVPDEILKITANYIGTNAAPSFVPYWKEETRWYYKGQSTLWKQASAYAAARKWENAAEKWTTLYENSSGKTKAKAASNLALAEEMKGEFVKAHEWAIKSRDLFKESLSDDARETKLLTAYAEVLSTRIQSDKKLNIQFGQE